MTNDFVDLLSENLYAHFMSLKNACFVIFFPQVETSECAYLDPQILFF